MPVGYVRVVPLACVALLAACAGPEQSSMRPGDAPPILSLVATQAGAGDGAAIFLQRCAACHQMKGEGLTGMYPPLAKSPIVNGEPSIPIRIVLRGLQGPIVVNGKKYNGIMPPFGLGTPMTDADVAAVLTYVRRSFGNGSAAVAETDVATERTATAARTTPWTAKDLGIP